MVIINKRYYKSYMCPKCKGSKLHYYLGAFLICNECNLKRNHHELKGRPVTG